MEKRLLYICNRCFWPPFGGHEVEMYHYCRGLHDAMGYTIDVYLFEDEEKISLDSKPYFINEVYISDKISKFDKFSNIFKYSLFGSKAWPIQCSLYYSKENENKIEQLAKNNYHAIFVDMIRLAPYFNAFKDVDAIKVLDIDDMLSKRYKRQLNSIDKNTVVAGQYNERLPLFLQKVLRLSIFKKLILKFEIPRMQRAEEFYAKQFDNVVFVSALETEEFNKKNNSNKAVTIAMGVDYNYFSEDYSVEKEEGVASFVGNMKTAANIDSVRLIIEKVLPYSKELKRIDFIGTCPQELVDEFQDNSRVNFTGKIKDLRESVKNSCLFLAPLAYGTGIKTKILEAMAMGVPVVTNTVGAEGIGAENIAQWLVSDDYEELGNYIDFLIRKPKEAEKIGRQGQQLIKEQFQWEHIFEQFNKLGL